MRTKKVPAPTIGSVVIVGLSSASVRPAIVYQAEGSRVFAQVQGPRLTDEQSFDAIGYNPSNNNVGGIYYGEKSPGVPALNCWCWPPYSLEQIDVPGDE